MTADVLGAPIKRVEDPRFITGKGRYLDDVQLTGATHLAILRSPYAHARIASILTQAAERGLDTATGDVSLLTHPAELALVRKMLLLPELVETIAVSLEPHHLPHYAQDLANSFHEFYEKCRVLPRVDTSTPLPEGAEDVDAERAKARLRLVAAAKVVLARTLSLMGMSAPERM